MFLAIVFVEVVFRVAERRALGKDTEVLATATVAVIHPKREAAQQELVLPSTLQAFTESPIYARTNGYVSKWYHDIGSHVQKGELLAEIETPEIDQELMQARAAREQATAQMEIANTSAQRWDALRKMDAVAQQELMNA
jgi:membrane fusion protein, multidrug efflux system